MKKSNKKLFILLASLLFVCSLFLNPVLANATTKTSAIKTLPKSITCVSGDTSVAINGTMTTKTGYIKATVTNGTSLLSVKSVKHKSGKTAFTVYLNTKGSKTGTAKIKIKTYRDRKYKKLVSTKYVSVKVISAKLNVTKKTLAAGSSFTLDLPYTNRTIKVTNGNSKVLKITKKTNHSVTIKALKGNAHTVSVKVKVGNKTLTCKITAKCKTHTYKATVTKKATCTKNGVMTYVCKNCGKTYTKTIKATGHDYKNTKIVKPTCTEDGYTLQTCANCGTTRKVNIVKATGHDYDEGNVTKRATCIEEGERTYTCKTCGKTKTETIKATGHSIMHDEIKEPTCCEEGILHYFCANPSCDYYYDESIPMVDHDYYNHERTKEPTCTEKGVETYTCIWCGKTYTEDIPALGHDFSVHATKDQNCEVDGAADYNCRRCGYKYTEIIPALGHHYDEGTVTKEATCTEKGEITYHCTNFDDLIMDTCKHTKTEEIPALGHDYDEGTVTKEATCAEEGEMTYVCKRCKEKKTEIIPKTTNHHYDEGVVTKEATCDEDGVMTYTCSVCKDTYTKVIPAMGHAYEDVKTQVYVVDEYEWDEKIVTGHRPYYNCLACGKKFYIDQYDSINAAGSACSNHCADECEINKSLGYKYGTSAGADEIFYTVHHDEIGHYNTIIKHICKNCGKEK